jgi:hypothetical protein
MDVLWWSLVIAVVIVVAVPLARIRSRIDERRVVGCRVDRLGQGFVVDGRGRSGEGTHMAERGRRATILDRSQVTAFDTEPGAVISVATNRGPIESSRPGSLGPFALVVDRSP